MKTIKKYFPVFYITLLVFIFFYVKSALKEENITVQVADEKKESREIKPVDVELIVQTDHYYADYQAKMENVNTFDDFLEYLRDNKGFYFEKTEYLYGTEYEDVNHLKIPQGYKWHVYENTEEITNHTSGRELKDNSVYKLILEKS